MWLGPRTIDQPPGVLFTPLSPLLLFVSAGQFLQLQLVPWLASKFTTLKESSEPFFLHCLDHPVQVKVSLADCKLVRGLVNVLDSVRGLGRGHSTVVWS